MLDLVFESFTEQARKVVVFAHEEAQGLKHNYIGTEHILLGLLRDGEGLAARVLEGLDITIEPVRAQIVGSGPEATSGQIAFTPRAKKVLDLALQEALGLGHTHIRTEHILLGIVRESEGVAASILLGFDAHAEKIHSEVIRMLSGPGDHDREPQRALDWPRARLLWRPEGLELRIPLHLNEGAIAALAADAAWSSPPLEGMRREIWDGWLALASPSLLDETDPVELRQVLDSAARRALDVGGREHKRVEDFLRRLRDAE
jgi:hypothetical protein